MSAFERIIGYETIKKELEQITDMFKNKAIYEALGAKMPHGLLLYGNPGLGGISENANARIEAVVHAELERYMRGAKDILLKNREFLEKVTEALIEKETLLYSNVRAIRESVTITDVAV